MRYKILLLFTFLSLSLQAQKSEWIRYTKNSLITSFADEGDYIWFTGSTGLTRMHKETGVKTYFNRINCPIPDDYISHIVMGNSGELWCGAQVDGVYRMQDGNWSVFNRSNTDPPVESIADLSVDADNNLWVATHLTNGGLFRYDGEEWVNYNISNSPMPDDYINCVFAVGNIIWVGSIDQLIRIDGDDWTIWSPENSNISGYGINKIRKDTKGNIWIMHYTGLEKFDGTSFTLYSDNSGIPNRSIQDMDIDDNDIIWTACRSYTRNAPGNEFILGGIMSFDGNQWLMYDSTNSPLADIDYLTIYADESNKLWFCDYSGDLIESRQGNNWKQFQGSPVPDYMFNFGDIFFNRESIPFFVNGYYRSQIVSFDWFDWEIEQEFPYYVIMARDENKNLLARSYQNLYRENDQGDWILLSDESLGDNFWFDEGPALAVDHEGIIWADYFSGVINPEQGYFEIYDGLAFFDGDTWNRLEFTGVAEGIKANIYDIEFDSWNNVWLGTSQGLLKYDHMGWEWIPKPEEDYSGSADIKDLLIDSLDHIWVDDGHFGFYEYDGSVWIRHEHPELSQYVTYSHLQLLEDTDGTIWLNAYRQLIHYDGQVWETINSSNSPLPALFSFGKLSIDDYGNKWLGSSDGVFIYKKGGVISPQPPESEDNSIEIWIYPNPFDKEIRVMLSEMVEDLTFSLYNLNGVLVYSQEFTIADRFKVRTRDLGRGMYLYVLWSEGQILGTGKLLAE